MGKQESLSNLPKGNTEFYPKLSIKPWTHFTLLIYFSGWLSAAAGCSYHPFLCFLIFVSLNETVNS